MSRHKRVIKRGEIYRECSSDRIEAYVYLVNKIRRVADTHEGAARIDVVLPSIQFIVVFESHVNSLLFRLEEQATRFGAADPSYVIDILKVYGHRHGARLEEQKMRLSRDQADRR